MGLFVGKLQTLDRDMGVDLRCRQTGMAEHLLDSPKVGTALEQMSGRTVPQTVRPHIWGIGHVLHQLMDSPADLAGVDPATSSAQEQGRTTSSRVHLTAAKKQPPRNRGGRRAAERDSPFPGSLAHDSDQVGAQVKVVDVQAHELADPNPTRIQQFHHRAVSQMHCVLVIGAERCDVQHFADLILLENSWQSLHASGCHQTQGWVR